jgi:hypothetical protein
MQVCSCALALKRNYKPQNIFSLIMSTYFCFLIKKLFKISNLVPALIVASLALRSDALTHDPE